MKSTEKSLFDIFAESDFYKKYTDRDKLYFLDSVKKYAFGFTLRRHRFSIKNKTYQDIIETNIEVMRDFLELFLIGHDIDDEIKRCMLDAIYIDPDRYDKKTINNVDCTADGLLSKTRIYRKYGFSEEMIKEYEAFHKMPIFYFPSERPSINTMRSIVFGDRIDHTLFDIKNKLEGKDHRLGKAYRGRKTEKWLSGFDSDHPFESFIEKYSIRGIFTDENNNVFDLEKDKGIIVSYKNKYTWEWSDKYYENVKNKIAEFIHNQSLISGYD